MSWHQLPATLNLLAVQMISLPSLNSRRPEPYFPYHSQNITVKNILFHHLSTLWGNPRTAAAVSEPPLLAYRWDHNCRDNSRMQEPSYSPSSQFCTKACSRLCCYTCKHVLLTPPVTFPKGRKSLQRSCKSNIKK